MTSELSRLTDLRAVRTRLDEEELELIHRARHAGATWAQIAAALGLASRQAAEQRRQRLAAARSSRRRSLDLRYPPAIAAIRNAVSDLRRWIDTDRRWDSRFRRAELVRRTAEAALDAPPGALYALALLIAADLAEAGPDRLPAPVRAVAAALDGALSTPH
ncbi:hypothetical protein Q3W71_14240 [Micromonospora sp. C28SCA-DRY-2]|uniref:hypothetical protein n=1 Tax=Micromonospora sp. C28SCA-DRY-2 TaxID=3059522 RepID=UPI002675C28B|nr:hypothetical protein [Micromonospora sp. C28SCA-DRY-2]MDO3702828.1 hypothetical protein [Micromonospora sp. C28SCA-DRY-2]